MRYGLIALDLDGTLLTSRKDISPRTRAALSAARERGIVTVIATGRTARSAREFSRQIGGGPVICCNGAAILDEQGAFVTAKGLPLAPLRRALEVCRAEGVMTECYTPEDIVLDQPIAQARAYLRWVRPRLSLTRSLISLVGLWRMNRMRVVRNLLKWTEQPDLPPVLKLMIISEDRGALGRVAQRIGAEMPGLGVTSSGPDNLEVMAAGVSKGAGLEQLGARLKIARSAIIAFGDSDNDLEMLRYAGVGVAMGNAADSVKAAADRVTATCDEDGIAQTIEELCLS